MNLRTRDRKGADWSNRNIKIKHSFLEITLVKYWHKHGSTRSYLYLQALNQCSWASDLAEGSRRWQDIHLGTRREGCTMLDRGEDEGTLCVLQRGCTRGSHHSRSGLIRSLATSVLFLFCAVGNDVSPLTMYVFEMFDVSGLTWGGRRRQLISHLRCSIHIAK